MKRAVEEILKFNEERDWDQFHNPENLAKSISIEAGELLECFQWNNEYDKQHVCEELADVMNYCILMANKLGVDMEEILLMPSRPVIMPSIPPRMGVPPNFSAAR